VSAERGSRYLSVTVTDDGSGLPPGFAAEASDRLGLQIVRSLVTAELGGGLQLQSRPDGLAGTRAVVSMQLARRNPQPVG
jgi:two-component system, sensor histidine kinase PdtaS